MNVSTDNTIRRPPRPNEDLRQYAKQHGVRHWEIAERNLINECTLSKYLRHELPPDEKEKYMRQIREIAEGR